jgi:predicted XRE-type DNA-binding protein
MAHDMTEGSGNVFADLGHGDAIERQAKARLAMAVNALLQERRLKQTEAAAVLGIPQSKVSALVNYRLDQFSADKLMAFLNALGRDVEIIVRPRRAAVARIAVYTLTPTTGEQDRPHAGAGLDDLLAEEGVLEEVRATAFREVAAWQRAKNPT